MKTYVLTFEDHQGNELEKKEISAFNIKDARQTRDKLKAESKINDLFKIKIKAK